MTPNGDERLLKTEARKRPEAISGRETKLLGLHVCGVKGPIRIVL